MSSTEAMGLQHRLMRGYGGLLVDEQNIVLDALWDSNDAARHVILVAPHMDLLGSPVAWREEEGMKGTNEGEICVYAVGPSRLADPPLSVSLPSPPITNSMLMPQSLMRSTTAPRSAASLQVPSTVPPFS